MSRADQKVSSLQSAIANQEEMGEAYLNLKNEKEMALA